MAIYVSLCVAFAVLLPVGLSLNRAKAKRARS